MGRVTLVFLFTCISILFINIGFYSLYLEQKHISEAYIPVLVSSIGLLIVNIAYLLVFFLKKSKKTMLYSPQLKKDSYSSIVLISMIVYFFVSLYFVLLGYVPLFKAIKDMLTYGFQTGTLNSYRVSRNIYINPDAAYIPLQGFFQTLRYFGLPVCISLNLFYVKEYKVAKLMVVIALFLLIISGQRWPLMYALMGLVIYFSYLKIDKKKLNLTLRKIIIITVSLGIFTSVLLGRNTVEGETLMTNIWMGVIDLYNRIFLGNALVPFLSYTIFPSEVSYYYGWTWIQNLLAYLPGPFPSFPVTFYQLVFKDDTGFTAPPDFYTEAYINFSWLGVMVISFLWGTFIYFIETLFSKAKTVYHYSYLVLLGILISFTSFSGMTFLIGGVIIIIFIEIIRYTSVFIMKKT